MTEQENERDLDKERLDKENLDKENLDKENLDKENLDKERDEQPEASVETTDTQASDDKKVEEEEKDKATREKEEKEQAKKQAQLDDQNAQKDELTQKELEERYNDNSEVEASNLPSQENVVLSGEEEKLGSEVSSTADDFQKQVTAAEEAQTIENREELPSEVLEAIQGLENAAAILVDVPTEEEQQQLEQTGRDLEQSGGVAQPLEFSEMTEYDLEGVNLEVLVDAYKGEENTANLGDEHPSQGISQEHIKETDIGIV